MKYINYKTTVGLHLTMVHSMKSLFSLYFGILRPSWSNYKAFIGHVREVYGRTQLALLYPSPIYSVLVMVSSGCPMTSGPIESSMTPPSPKPDPNRVHSIWRWNMDEFKTMICFSLSSSHQTMFKETVSRGNLQHWLTYLMSMYIPRSVVTFPGLLFTATGSLGV